MAKTSRMFPMRLDDDTRARWQAAADAQGLKLTEWVKRAAEAALQPHLTVIHTPPAERAEPTRRGKGKGRAAVAVVDKDKPSDLKKVDQAMCEHRIPVTAFCPRCR